VDLITRGIVDQCKALVVQLALVPEAERVDALNELRVALHEVSPFREEPVDCVLWVPADTVHANDYNPNTVAPPEMRLLARSIEADGYTQPVVTFQVGDAPVLYSPREVVDGFHRKRIGTETLSVRKRVRGYLPVTTIRTDRAERGDRIAATIRHNRARGKHGVSAMSEIVVELTRRNWSDARIAKELGMDADEVLRLKQVTGLAALFANDEYNEAWE
jgi:ParB-like chromosome segregation protein Spo0J